MGIQIFLFLTKIYALGTQWKHLENMFSMSSHNTRFHEYIYFIIWKMPSKAIYNYNCYESRVGFDAWRHKRNN